MKTNVVANGAGLKVGRKPAVSPIASGATTPVEDDGSRGSSRVSRPDKATYDKEQEELRVQIAVLQEKMVSMIYILGCFCLVQLAPASNLTIALL